MYTVKRLSALLLLVIAPIFMTACNSTTTKPAKPAMTVPAATENTVSEIYEVFEDGRIYAFYDYKLYKQFLSVGETAYRLTRIGTGPNGETMVFGLTKDDKKKGVNTPAVKLYENKIKAADKFYGEARRHGRIYVFSNFKDMEPVRMFGHPNFFYMEVGAGPKGETVVYVLNKKTKKKKPVDLIAAFKHKNQ
jgi:hypothetical protein